MRLIEKLLTSRPVRKWILKRVCDDEILWNIVTGLRGPDIACEGAKWLFTARLRYLIGARFNRGSIRERRYSSRAIELAISRAKIAPFHYRLHMYDSFYALRVLHPDDEEITGLTWLARKLSYSSMGPSLEYILEQVKEAICEL